MQERPGPTTAIRPPTISGTGDGDHGPGHDPADPTSPNPLHRLSPAELDAIGEAFDRIHDEVRADLGARDSRYIRSLVSFQRRLEVAARLTLLGSRYTPAWIVGTAGLSLAKVLENMELGHNILHGQWDWMNDPAIHSSTWDWDNVSTAEGWKHSHNVVHHTYTNIVGMDKDVGYEVMRVSPKQRWEPRYLAQPVVNVVLMALFEWGVALHDLDFEAIRGGTKDPVVLRRQLKDIAKKAWRQTRKDYLIHPLLAGGGRRRVLAANVTANLVRNVWANAIIFCGHFPDQAYMFTVSEVAGETRGAWYVRQLLGAANIEGGDAFHVLSGNLGFQIEHHLFPDLPSSRLKEVAPRVRAICEEHGLPYNSGPFLQQWLMVQRSILRLAFPGGEEHAKGEPHHEPPAPEPAPRTVDGVRGPIAAFP